VAHLGGESPGQPWFLRITVESRTVTTAGYDDRSSTMELEFVDGGVYRYFVVPRSVFDALLAADSIGRFFHDHIRGVYPFTRIR
jgi:KTSC domain